MLDQVRAVFGKLRVRGSLVGLGAALPRRLRRIPGQTPDRSAAPDLPSHRQDLVALALQAVAGIDRVRDLDPECFDVRLPVLQIRLIRALAVLDRQHVLQHPGAIRHPRIPLDAPNGLNLLDHVLPIDALVVPAA